MYIWLRNNFLVFDNYDNRNLVSLRKFTLVARRKGMLHCASRVENACGRESEWRKAEKSRESEGKEELMKKGKQGLYNAIHVMPMCGRRCNL